MIIYIFNLNFNNMTSNQSNTINQNTILILKGQNLSERSKNIFPSNPSLSKITDVSLSHLLIARP